MVPRAIGALTLCLLTSACSPCPLGTREAGAEPVAGFEVWCERDGPEGQPIRHGPTTAWHESRTVWPAGGGEPILQANAGPDAGVAWRGRYEDGERHGRWQFIGLRGIELAQGTYDRGDKVGAWLEGSGELYIMRAAGIDDWPNHIRSELRQGTYVAGKKHGTWLYRNRDGTRLASADYRSGLRHGAEIQWCGNGQVEARTEFRDDERHGVSAGWHCDGTKRSERHFVAGIAQGASRYWDAHGQLSTRGSYVDGKREGAWVEDDALGWIKGSYQQGKPHGEWTLYDERSTVLARGVAVNGHKDGRWEWYHLNGMLQRSGSYRNCKRHGVWKTWDLGGRPVERAVFVDGELRRVEKQKRRRDSSADTELPPLPDHLIFDRTTISAEQHQPGGCDEDLPPPPRCGGPFCRPTTMRDWLEAD